MSELIDNSKKRKEMLKHLILQIHQGSAAQEVKIRLRSLLGQIPYDEVVEVEQELIAEGLPQQEVLKLCDVHSEVLKGAIDRSGEKKAPPGHPVHTFLEENRLLAQAAASLKGLGERRDLQSPSGLKSFWEEARAQLRSLSDVEKHYRRKENLLFPYLEKHGISGPPAVMWGKHDETRALLKRALEAAGGEKTPAEDSRRFVAEVLQPLAASIEEMIFKEENLLFPMSLDTLSEAEWYEIYRQSPEIGFCLFDPRAEWRPQAPSAGAGAAAAPEAKPEERIRLPSGSFSPAELQAVLNSLTVDVTFVDAEDTVRFFNQSPQRIFTRTRAILGRKVQQCHPPESVHVVERILKDFKAGREDRAAFWIELKGRFVHIEYVAVRDPAGKYLGTLEVSQDLTEKRRLAGEQRLLSYGSPA
jgi:PAS domain S-box-containing protein